MVKVKSHHVKLKIAEFCRSDEKCAEKKQSEFDVCRYAKRRLQRRKWGGLWDREEAYNYIQSPISSFTIMPHTIQKGILSTLSKERKTTYYTGSKDKDY